MCCHPADLLKLPHRIVVVCGNNAGTARSRWVECDNGGLCLVGVRRCIEDGIVHLRVEKEPRLKPLDTLRPPRGFCASPRTCKALLRFCPSSSDHAHVSSY